MTGWQYLKQILTKEQMQAVRFAKKYGYTIIVSGPQGPTGKTTVKVLPEIQIFCQSGRTFCLMHLLKRRKRQSS